MAAYFRKHSKSIFPEGEWLTVNCETVSLLCSNHDMGRSMNSTDGKPALHPDLNGLDERRGERAKKKKIPRREVLAKSSLER